MKPQNSARWLAITRLDLTIGALLLSLGAQGALAGSFSVSPLRVEMKGKERLEVLTINNGEDTPLKIQVDLKDWSQSGGEDQYADTHELLATPPVFTMPPHGQQVLRIALRRPSDAARELEYRVFLTELPPPPSEGFSGMQVALQLSLPVFVDPPVASQASLAWHAAWQSDGSVRVTATNTGNAHARVSDFELQFGSPERSAPVSVSRYILPQSQVSWLVKPPDGAAPHTSLQVQGHSDRGEFTSTVPEGGA
jgi:fimbrial chaperone protein